MGLNSIGNTAMPIDRRGVSDGDKNIKLFFKVKQGEMAPYIAKNHLTQE
jgi:hypothetical protein